MSNKEFKRLKSYHLAALKKPQWLGTSRRMSKSKGNATGLVLRTSRVRGQVGLEKQFPRFK
jgi:hypothetical protein